MEVGYIKSIKGSIAYLDGLPSVHVGDLVASDSGDTGFVSALLSNCVEVMLLKKETVRPGQMFKPCGSSLSIRVGEHLLGKAINPLGESIEIKGSIPKDKGEVVLLDSPTPGVAERRFIREQFETGISLIDTLVPLGRGQRELIIGDARSGKTGFVLDVISNQKNKKVICIYACIAKAAPDVRDLLRILKDNGSLDYTVMVVSFSADSAPMIYLTPQTAMAVASYFQRQGRDVLVILDDMGAHAKVYREISLLADRPPGREAYPGDIFYEHAHLMEKAGNFASSAGGGSITALPVIELGLTDFTGFVSTNLMSMTDGHLLFSSTLYGQGKRPAVDLSLSVSRVGQQTQNRIQTQLAFKIRQLLTEAEQLSTLTSFSVELPLFTRLLLTRKLMIEEILKQAQKTSIPLNAQTILLTLPFCAFLESRNEQYFVAYKKVILDMMQKDGKLNALMQSVPELSSIDELITKLNEIGEEFIFEKK